jgi:radical SAM protein with 4Fe4S-binding SPASM domain
MIGSAQVVRKNSTALSPPPLPVLYSRAPDIVDYQDSKVLLVWGDIPHWAVVDVEFFMFLQELRRGASMHDAARAVAYTYGHTICSTMSRLKKKLPGFISAGVVYSHSPAEKAPAPCEGIENITVNVTRRCNLNCCFCYNLGMPAPEREAPLKQILTCLERALPFTAEKRALTILGGEPTLRPGETLELARWGKANGFDTTVSTNGLLIDRDFARAAAACGLSVQVSIDGPTVYEHESLRGRGTFARARKAVRLLVRHGVRVITNMVVHEDNQWRVEDFFCFSKRLGAAGVRFVPLRRIGGGGSLRPPDLVKLLRSVRTILALHKSYHSLASEDWFSTLASTCRMSLKRTSCGAATRTMLIDADGSIYPCTGQALPEFRLGHVKDSFRRMWTRSQFVDGLRKRFNVDQLNGRCAKCAMRYWCVGGCRGEAYARTGSCLEPSPTCVDTRNAIIEMFWILSEIPKFSWQTSPPCSGK